MSTLPAPLMASLSGKLNLTPMAHLLAFAEEQDDPTADKTTADIMVDLSRDRLTNDPAARFLSLPPPIGLADFDTPRFSLLRREDNELIDIITALGPIFGRLFFKEAV